MSQSFQKAFPALNDLIGLFDLNKNKQNPAVRKFKDEISKRITKFYQEKDKNRSNNISNRVQPPTAYSLLDFASIAAKAAKLQEEKQI